MELTDISKYKDKVLNINIAIIILAMIITYNIYKRQTAILKSLKQQIDIETKKNDALSNIDQLEKRINAYKNYLGKKDLSLIIARIDGLAKDSNIKIFSFTPQPARDYPVYIKYPFSLTIAAKDYRCLSEFISKIEDSPDIYMVDSISIKSLYLEQKEEALTNKIGADLVISTIVFKG